MRRKIERFMGRDKDEKEDRVFYGQRWDNSKMKILKVNLVQMAKK